MGSSFAPNPLFDEPQGYEISLEAFSPRAAHRPHPGLRDFTPTLIAMGGLALFACALVVAFRIITLDASRQLQQPAIDFAVCGAIAFLGLSISWVHLGDRPASEAEELAADLDMESQPMPAALPAPAGRQVLSRRRIAAQACPFCGENMISLGLARHYCHGCGHLEGNVPISFLDSASACPCDNCRQNLQHPV
ncbi:MAG TPA: hypothetical protein VJQ50_10855 [Terriglobales bacterium]|nr:hypothetical protein [Terriglobales bacterium]